MQRALARGRPEAEPAAAGADLVGGCFVCFDTADRAYAGAALTRAGRPVTTALAIGVAAAAYEPGLLALREGPVLESAVRRLPRRPEVLVVNATGTDHPRRAGLAVHLGAVLGLPTVGVTHRPLLARGAWPPDVRGAVEPVLLEGTEVGAWVRTRAGTRPVVAHEGWATDVATAVAVVLAAARRARTPEPVRRARQVARRARGRAGQPRSTR